MNGVIISSYTWQIFLWICDDRFFSQKDLGNTPGPSPAAASPLSIRKRTAAAARTGAGTRVRNTAKAINRSEVAWRSVRVRFLMPWSQCRENYSEI